MPLVKRHKRGEGVRYVTCRLCGRDFLWISPSHLSYTHGWSTPHPLDKYKARYGVRRLDCLLTARKRQRQVALHLAREGKLWTKERLRALVHRRIRRGLPLHWTAITSAAPSAPPAAKRLFGGWSTLLERCGLDYDRVRQRREWTPAKILAAIREAHRRGDDLAHGAIQRRDSGLEDAAVSRFGSWDRALRAAGLDPRRVRKTNRWTRKSILKAILAINGSTRHCDVERSNSALTNAAMRFFRSWGRAVRAAGLDYLGCKAPKKWTLDRIQDEIRSRVRCGLTLRYVVIASAEPGLLRAARRNFPSWRAAVEAAGCSRAHPPRHHPWTRAELIDLLQDLRRRNGYVSGSLLGRTSRPGYINPLSAACRLFGGIGPARRAIGAHEDGRGFWNRMRKRRSSSRPSAS